MGLVSYCKESYISPHFYLKFSLFRNVRFNRLVQCVNI